MGRSFMFLHQMIPGKSIVKKMMISYICIIFLPVVLFGVYYYNQMSVIMMEKVQTNRQQIMEQAYYNLKVDLAHFESLYKLLQYNPFVVDYLSGIYISESENVYNYLRYINPLLLYSLSGNPNLSDITIYKNRSEVFAIPTHIVDVSHLQEGIRKNIDRLKPNQGMWVYDAADRSTLTSLYYYQKLYDRTFLDVIGILEIKVSPGIFQPFLKALGAESHWHAYLQTEQGDIITPNRIPPDLTSGAALSAQKASSGGSTIINKLTIGELRLSVVTFGEGNEIFSDIKVKEKYLAAVIILLLLTLSFIYYLLASSVGNRLSHLARHMRSVDESNLKVYPSPNNGDEIGFLTSSYNAMVMRVEELINNVHRAEVMRKEAEFKALQAQVKPHFLYNTLETIRMMAEAKNVPEVAGITYSFGQLMRYSLSSSREETRLSKEVEMVRNYLEIHQIRLKNRLQYEINGIAIADSLSCPRFILQPIVENCVVHGISKVRRPIWIRIRISEEDAFIVITVEDNGGGMHESRLLELCRTLSDPADEIMSPQDGGFGLPNVCERIKSYYGGHSRLMVDSQEGTGTTVRMFLNKKRDDVDC